jgi:hypothetical protein
MGVYGTALATIRCVFTHHISSEKNKLNKDKEMTSEGAQDIDFVIA